MKEIFMKEALKNIAKDWDISGESYEFTSVMNEYDKYFTFTKVETAEDKKRAYQIIDRLFVYLYPYLGGSRSDYMTSAIAKAAKETGALLSIAEEGYPSIRKMIEKNALNSERAFKELKEVGIDLGAIY
jgi:hypothetical protein